MSTRRGAVQLAPLFLKAIENRSDCSGVIRRMIEIAAHWSSFHLADDEFQARATVQKARELIGNIELMEAREAKQRELARKEELARMEREQAEVFRKQSELLLMMFDELAMSADEQRRGFLLQDILNRTFDLHAIPVVALQEMRAASRLMVPLNLKGGTTLLNVGGAKSSVILENSMAYQVKLHVPVGK